MRHSRRFVLLSGAGYAVPTFDGSYSLFGDAKKGYIEIYSSGTLTFSKRTIVDVFVVGSGLRGVDGSETSSGTISYQYGGAGGKGAKGATYTGIEAMGDYAITIAAACSSTGTANASSAFGNSVRATGASGGAGSNASYGTNGKNGSSGVSIPFGDSANFPTNYGGGGGGGGGSKYDSSIAVGSSYMPGSGGSVGGGRGALVSAAGAGQTNTGGGGGGGSGTRQKGANGGSGLVIVRWGDWSGAA